MIGTGPHVYNPRLTAYRPAATVPTAPAPRPLGGAVSATALPNAGTLQAAVTSLWQSGLVQSGFDWMQGRLATWLRSLAPKLPLPGPGPVPAPTPVPTVPPPVTPGGAGALSADQLRRGAFAGCLFGSTTQDGKDTAERMAAQLGRPLDANHSFYRWDHAIPSAEDRADVAAGRVPFISWNAKTRDGQPVQWADIASGAHDARIAAMARGLKSLGKPVLFTFNHEPENDGVRGTPEAYKAAWKRISDIMTREGATNAVKVYVTMGWKPELSEAFYPGDAVDWIAGDPYNWAYSANNPTAAWRSFEQAATPFYTWARAKGKPLMISETGCIEDPAQPNRKADWIRQMGETLKKWPEVKALTYFNNVHDDGSGNNGWRLETPQALAAFKAMAQDPYFARH